MSQQLSVSACTATKLQGGTHVQGGTQPPPPAVTAAYTSMKMCSNGPGFSSESGRIIEWRSCSLLNRTIEQKLHTGEGGDNSGEGVGTIAEKGWGQKWRWGGDNSGEGVGTIVDTGRGTADRGQEVYMLPHPWKSALDDSSRVRKWVPPKCSARRPSTCSSVERSLNTAYSLSWSSPPNSRCTSAEEWREGGRRWRRKGRRGRRKGRRKGREREWGGRGEGEGEEEGGGTEIG